MQRRHRQTAVREQCREQRSGKYSSIEKVVLFCVDRLVIGRSARLIPFSVGNTKAVAYLMDRAGTGVELSAARRL